MTMRPFSRSDQAVSPVIAVILMVAITVVLAATVYVWVSGFGAGGSAPARSLALTSSGAITSDCSNDGATTPNDCKSYTIASASPGLRYGDVTLSLGGSALAMDPAGCASVLGATTEYGACGGATARTSGSLVMAGDTLKIAFNGASGLSGKTLLVVDAGSNSVILTLTVS